MNELDKLVSTFLAGLEETIVKKSLTEVQRQYILSVIAQKCLQTNGYYWTLQLAKEHFEGDNDKS